MYNASRVPIKIDIDLLAPWSRCELVFNSSWYHYSSCIPTFHIGVEERVLTRLIASKPTNFAYSVQNKTFTWKDGISAEETESYLVWCVERGQPCSASASAFLNVSRGIQTAQASWNNAQGNWTCYAKSKNSIGEQCSSGLNITHFVEAITNRSIAAPPTNLTLKMS
jgi:hypothetical protein